MSRLVLSLALLSAAACNRGALSIASDPAQQGLTVHEWGTYTSVQGSNGATLEGMQHEEEALPDFVARRSVLPLGEKGIESLPQPVNQKLETPVLYFYAEKAQHLRIAVDFPGGIVSQWFPAAATFSPAVGALTAIAAGHMEWQADLRPGNDLAAMRAVPADSVWAPSRNTASVPLAIGADVEKFIFYRGLGRFDVPFRVTSSAAGLLDLSNDSDEDIAEAFLLNVHDTTGKAVALGRISAHASLRGVTGSLDGKEHDLDTFTTETMATVAAALERSGLYADEARAMVETWRRSYFRSPGIRILYVAPRAWTDRLLPLRIDPTPDATVRTLVGRVEIFTATDEAALLTRARTESASALVSSLGRFAEPKLRRVRSLAADSAAVQTLDAAIGAASSQP